MSVQAHVQLGDEPPLSITLRDEAWVGSAMRLASDRADDLDVVAATAAALESPAGFPAISQAIVPDDTIAIALGDGVRQSAQVVRGVVAALDRAGAGRETVRVVVGDVNEGRALREELADLLEDGLLVIAHEANDDQALCYLAAVDESPLLVSRQLFEADVVIPVGCGRATTARDSRGPYESIYPRFSDVVTQQRFAQADALDSPAAASRRRDETDRAGWLLGAALVVQVVPARGGGIAQVVAGTPDEVDRLVASACADEWVAQVDEPARLVVTTLTGGPAEQSWDNVARALHAAGQAADQDDSAVAICTQLSAPPGESLQKLMEVGGDLDRAARLHDAQSPDAAAAWEIYKALCRGPLYFMSQLDDDVVESLGMTPIVDAAELVRLAERSQTCAVLNEGQHTVPKFAE